MLQLLWLTILANSHCYRFMAPSQMLCSNFSHLCEDMLSHLPKLWFRYTQSLRNDSRQISNLITYTLLVNLLDGCVVFMKPFDLLMPLVWKVSFVYGHMRLSVSSRIV